MTSGLDRRALLGLAIVAAAPGAAVAEEQHRPLHRTPADFLWGTAGASYQIEGGNYASDVWLLEHVSPTIYSTPSGDAANTYSLIDQDLALAASLGFNCHRLSLEWSRIEPDSGQVSLAGLAYYRQVLLKCRALGMTPVVTYNHWTVPRWFAAAGGFESPESVSRFSGYCKLVTEHLGDLIGVAATFNEANIVEQLSWIPGFSQYKPVVRAMLKAAAAKSGSDRFTSFPLADPIVQRPILLQAHAQAYDAIKSVRADLPVGFTLSLSDDQAFGQDSALARKEAEVWTPWLQARGDWVGVQVYSRTRVGPESDLAPEPGVELTQAGYEFWPESLEAVIRKVAKMQKRPIYVTENGIATADDTRRVEYIRRAVRGLQRCLNDGIDVRGYMHWSLLDNWEWIRGYSQQFGLVSVDRSTFQRTPKPSAAYLGRIARNRGLQEL